MTHSDDATTDPRDQVVNRAKRQLDRQIDGWLGAHAERLTAAEFVSIVSAVLAETLNSWARQEIRGEREALRNPEP